MTIHGVDVASPYQKGWTPNSLGAGDDDFVFVKATQGTGYTNPDRSAQAKAGRDKGLQIGWYHWLSASSAIDAQVDYFLAHVPLQDGDLLVCDWEESGLTTQDKDQFIKGVQAAQPSHKVGLYCNTNWWKNVDTTGFFGDFLWIAAYQSSKPDLEAPISFWQYAKSPIDQNHGYFTDRAALKDWAGGKSGGGTATEDVWPTQSAIQVPYGTKGDMWASGYHQGDDWHRNAGAAEIGDPIYAVASGTVIYADDARYDGGGGWGSAFGKHVLIQWDQHGRTSIDAHMSKIIAKAGQRVSVGDKIGEKGDTGNVSGPHDHHEQHTGTRWTDPDVKPIYPGKTTSGGGSGEDDDMAKAKHVKMHRTTDQKIKTADKDAFQWLFLDEDDHTSVAIVPSKIVGLVYLQVSGLLPTDSIYLRAGSYDITKKDSGNVATPVTVNEPDRRQGNSAGWLSESIPVVWDLGDQAAGQDYRALRFMVASNTKNASIVNCRFEGYVTEK